MKTKIQYLAFSEDKRFEGNGVTLSKISSPRSLDEFDLNIIDLNDDRIWKCNALTINPPNMQQELIDLKRMINESSKTKILVIIPQNIEYKYFWIPRISRFNIILKMKELIGDHLEYWISDLAILAEGILVYENTITLINGTNYQAAFHFSNNFFADDSDILTKSIRSNKNTTIKYFNTFFTVLQMESYDSLINFLNHIGLIELKETKPEWLLEISLFDDEKQRELIKKNTETICECEGLINIANEKMEKNNVYKSILYTNGDELVQVVFEMLEKMLKCDLSAFKDEKKEDFLINLGNVTFIGEIKGVTSNIKNEHISQLDVHYQGYIDMKLSDSEHENIKAILIMDHQRLQRPSERQPVHTTQIKLAERNESLIIETSTLLKLFEALTKSEIKEEDIINIFSERKGLLLF